MIGGSLAIDNQVRVVHAKAMSLRENSCYFCLCYALFGFDLIRVCFDEELSFIAIEVDQ